MKYQPRTLKQTETTIASIRLRNVVLSALEGIDEAEYSKVLSYDVMEGLGAEVATSEAPAEYDPEREEGVRYGIRHVLDEMCANAQKIDDKKKWMNESGTLESMTLYMNYTDGINQVEKILKNFVEAYPGGLSDEDRNKIAGMIIKARTAAYNDYGQYLLDSAEPKTSSLSL